MFVNYTHPDELREVGKRKQVLSFAARPRRNAALLQTAHRRGTFSWTREPTCCNSPQSSETESEVRKALSEHDSDVAQEASDDPMDDLLGYAPSGGLRVDPFGAFPVKVNPKATKAIDIYLQVYAPINSAGIQSGSKVSDAFMDILLPFTLQNPVTFGGWVTMCLCHAMPIDRLDPVTENEIYNQRGKALQALRESMANRSGLQADDASILTVTSLMASEYLLGHDENIDAHVNGLRSMVAIRGGLQCLGLSGVVRGAVSKIEYFCGLVTKRPEHRRAATNRPSVLTYPVQPFPSKLQSSIESIPSGFCSIAKSGQVSVQLIEILERYSLALNKPNSAHQAHLFNMMDDFKLLEQFDNLERSICLGVTIFHLKMWQANCPGPLYLSRLIQNFIAAFTGESQPQVQFPCLLWVATLIVKIHDPRVMSSESRLVLLEAIQRTRIILESSGEIITLLRTFYWDEGIPLTICETTPRAPLASL